MNCTSKRKILLFAITILQFAHISIKGQSWSIEYHVEGDSTVSSLSQANILVGKTIDFFFPAYKYYQSSSKDVIEAIRFDHSNIIEMEFNSKLTRCDMLNFEVDLYAEGIDTIRVFLKTTDDRLVLASQQATRIGYTYLPTINFSVNLAEIDYQSIQIVAKSPNDNSKLILGRLNGLKKVEFITDNIQSIESFVSKYPVEEKSDILFELPSLYLKLHGFHLYTRLVLEDCYSSYDSIQCISQFTNNLLNEYALYDLYGINKHELLNRNTKLAKTARDVDSYYQGMKEIIASLNCCHIRLITNPTESVESPSQPIYFYNINNKIVATAIFDSTLADKIQLGDILLSINNVKIDQLYKDFAKNVFASTSQQQEMKITQRLLYTARELWGDSLSLVFQNNINTYCIRLNKMNFSNKRTIPSGFKLASINMIEKYNKIIYFKPEFIEFSFNPFLYSHKEDFNNCEGLIVDLRGNSGGDLSCATFLSFFISENSAMIYSESNLFKVHSNYIVKPSDQIQIQAPIVVIVDARTTCMGEFFINALRKSKSNIYVVGASNTAGSAQLTRTAILPQNAILAYFEGIAKDAFVYVIDDNIGIAPDTLIRFKSYKDLFPYEDSLKRIALEYLEHKIESIIIEDIQY